MPEVYDDACSVTHGGDEGSLEVWCVGSIDVLAEAEIGDDVHGCATVGVEQVSRLARLAVALERLAERFGLRRLSRV